jgi:hypothetical protein
MSEVWQIFKKDELNSKVICNLCNKQYKNAGSSTTNLWNHLKFKHKTKFNELDQFRRGVSGFTIDEDE